MEETFYSLLFAFLCLAPFCGGALVIGLAAFFIIRTIGGQTKPPTAEQFNADGRDLKAYGTLPSVARSKEISWAAFGLRVRGAAEPGRILHARTSGQTFDYRLTRGGVRRGLRHLRLLQNQCGQIRLPLPRETQADGIVLDAYVFP